MKQKDAFIECLEINENLIQEGEGATREDYIELKKIRENAKICLY